MKIYNYYQGHPERWCQGSYEKSRGIFKKPAYCLERALKVLYGGSNSLQEDAAREKLHAEVLSMGYYGLLTFNDDPKRKFEDILELVKQVGV